MMSYFSDRFWNFTILKFFFRYLSFFLNVSVFSRFSWLLNMIFKISQTIGQSTCPSLTCSEKIMKLMKKISYGFYRRKCDFCVGWGFIKLASDWPDSPNVPFKKKLVNTSCKSRRSWFRKSWSQTPKPIVGAVATM